MEQSPAPDDGEFVEMLPGRTARQWHRIEDSCLKIGWGLVGLAVLVGVILAAIGLKDLIVIAAAVGIVGSAFVAVFNLSVTPARYRVGAEIEHGYTTLEVPDRPMVHLVSDEGRIIRRAVGR